MLIAALLENVSRQIRTMDPLHDDHFGSGLGIIQARRHHFVPPVTSVLADDVGLGIMNVVRIIAHDAIPTFAGVGAAHRSGNATSAAIVLEALLFVLVVGE